MVDCDVTQAPRLLPGIRFRARGTEAHEMAPDVADFFLLLTRLVQMLGAARPIGHALPLAVCQAVQKVENDSTYTPRGLSSEYA